MIFEDRREAGKLLAEKLLAYKGIHTIVIALPRGGVPVGYEVAGVLNVPLVALPVRKIGAPFNPEYAIGAIASGGTIILDEESVAFYNITDDEIEEIIRKEKKELLQTEKLFMTSETIQDKIVILIDDGLATGMTAHAAINAIKKRFPKKIILAVPCSPIETAKRCKQIVDKFICLESRDNFSAVGICYKNFNQVKDEEVMALLNSS